MKPLHTDMYTQVFILMLLDYSSSLDCVEGYTLCVTDSSLSHQLVLLYPLGWDNTTLCHSYYYTDIVDTI